MQHNLQHYFGNDESHPPQDHFENASIAQTDPNMQPFIKTITQNFENINKRLNDNQKVTPPTSNYPPQMMNMQMPFPPMGQLPYTPQNFNPSMIGQYFPPGWRDSRGRYSNRGGRGGGRNSHRYGGRNGGRNNQNVGRGNQPQRCNTLQYCLSHGACLHPSWPCNNPQPGHVQWETIDNECNGSTYYCPHA